MIAPKQDKPAEPESVAAMSDTQARELLQKILEQMGKANEGERQAERDRRDQDQLSSITFGEHGLEASNLAGLWRLANMYARADIVPDQYKGKPENCLIALQMAQRCRMESFAFMQSSYIVHGRPGIEGKLVIAMLNTSGKIKGRIRYEFSGQGDTRACTAIVVDAESGEEIRMPLDWATVQREGWHLPKGKGDYKVPSKWTTLTDQMFRYRTATFLVRAHYPEVMMGLRTTDEIEDEPEAAQPEPTRTGESRSDALARKLAAKQPNGEKPEPTPDEIAKELLQKMAEPKPDPEAKPKLADTPTDGGWLDLIQDRADSIKQAATTADVSRVLAQLDRDVDGGLPADEAAGLRNLASERLKAMKPVETVTTSQPRKRGERTF